MIQLLIKTSSGNTITIDVNPEETIERVKELIYIKTDIPSVFQILIYNGRIIYNHKKIEDYNITEGCMLYMNLRMNAGLNPLGVNRSIYSILGKRKRIE